MFGTLSLCSRQRGYAISSKELGKCVFEENIFYRNAVLELYPENDIDKCCCVLFGLWKRLTASLQLLKRMTKKVHFIIFPLVFLPLL